MMMKNIAFCLFIAAALMATVSAHAFETPVTDPQGKALLQKTADDLDIYAKQAGTPKFVWGNILNGGTILTLQFMPADIADPSQWTRMTSMTVYGLSGDAEADKELVNKLILGFESQYKRTATDVTDKNYIFNGDKAMYLQYTLNAGKPDWVQVASAFRKVSDKTYAFIQLNARVKLLTEDEVTTIHQMVNPKMVQLKERAK